MENITLKGTKKVEIPYFLNQIEHGTDKKVLIVGECVAADQISTSLIDKECKDVTTTDIRDRPEDGWLNSNTEWKHINSDFIEFDETNKYDYIISISVFEHFGLFWDNKSMFDNSTGVDDYIRWNHDIKGIVKSCKLLKDKDSKVIITLPAGPFMNYNESGHPILRYYDTQRQNLIKETIKGVGCKLTDEKFYYSPDYENWSESDSEINQPKFYHINNSYSPNVIWAFTIQKK